MSDTKSQWKLKFDLAVNEYKKENYESCLYLLDQVSEHVVYMYTHIPIYV